MKLGHLIARRRARVEMIPLIDCVFILLVFFIYSMLAMTIQRGIIVQLPTATAVDAGPDDAIVVTVTADGHVLVDKEPVPLDGVGAAVENAAARLARPDVVINAAAEARHRWVVRVLDELRGRGFSRVMVLAEAGDGPGTGDDRSEETPNP